VALGGSDRLSAVCPGRSDLEVAGGFPGRVSARCASSGAAVAVGSVRADGEKQLRDEVIGALHPSDGRAMAPRDRLLDEETKLRRLMHICGLRTFKAS
jgi:hypothetical protein